MQSNAHATPTACLVSSAGTPASGERIRRSKCAHCLSLASPRFANPNTTVLFSAQWASTQAVIDENHAERDRLRRIVQALSARYSARELAAALREGRDPREPPTLVDIPLCEQKTGKQTQGGKKKASPLEGAAGLLALALPHGFDGSGLDDVPVFDELQLPNPPPDQVDLSPYKLPQSTQLAPSDDTLVASATAAANGAGSNTLRPPSSASKSSSQPPLRIAIPADPSSGPPSLTSALPFTLPGLSTDGRSRSVTEGAPTRPASPTAVAAVARDQPPASRPPAAQPAPHYPSYPSSLAQPPRPAPPPLPSFPSRAPPPTFFYPILPSPLMSPRSIASLANKRHAALISQRDPRNRLARMMVHEQRFDRAMEKARAEAVEREKATLKGKRGVNGVDGNGEKGAREQERPAAKGTSPASPEEQHFAQQAALAWAASNGIAPASTNIASTSTSASAPNDTPTASSSPAASSAAAPAAYAAVEPYRPLARDVDPPLVDPLTERRRSSWLVSPVTGSTTGAFALLTTGRPVLTVDAAGATASAAGGSSSMSALFRTPSALTSASSGGLFGRISLSPMRSAFPHSAIEEGLRPFSSVRMPGDEGDEMGDERFEPRMESVDEWARFEPRQANEGERAVAAQAEARTVVEEEEDECAVEQADERGMETEDRKSAKSTRGDDEAGSGESDGDE